MEITLLISEGEVRRRGGRSDRLRRQEHIDLAGIPIRGVPATVKDHSREQAEQSKEMGSRTPKNALDSCNILAIQICMVPTYLEIKVRLRLSASTIKGDALVPVENRNKF